MEGEARPEPLAVNGYPTPPRVGEMSGACLLGGLLAVVVGSLLTVGHDRWDLAATALVVTGVTAFVSGVVLLFARDLIAYRRASARLRAVGVSTSGVVTFYGPVYEHDTHGHTEIHYRYAVGDEEREGQYTLQLIGTPPWQPTVGDEVNVLYDPDHPEISGWFAWAEH